eukprot:1471751-Rhodomonas_salina.3
MLCVRYTRSYTGMCYATMRGTELPRHGPTLPAYALPTKSPVLTIGNVLAAARDTWAPSIRWKLSGRGRVRVLPQDVYSRPRKPTRV